MNSHSASKRRMTASPGSSLVITLAFLVILTILAVGTVETIRMDRTSSTLYSDRTVASLMSQNAVELLVAKLQQSTSDVERHWLSQPGQIVVGAEKDDGNPANGDSRKILTGAKTPEQNPGSTDARIIPLHSGTVTTTSFPAGQEVLNPPNLNVTTFQDPDSSLITDRIDNSGTTVKMTVRWNYVRKDGAVDTSESPDLTSGSSKANPIVGRYAFWADDESAKVNYNLAWRRLPTPVTTSGTLPIGHPSRISLAALDVFGTNSALVDTLHQFITTDNYDTINKHLFNSPADARQVDPVVASALKANKFEVTHYNHDPDTTFFNEPRIVLTTRASRAAGRPYLKILADETVDPGYTYNLDQTKLNEVLFGAGGSATAPKSPGLVYYLSRTDWPMVSGTGSFQSKYFNGNISQLVQFAICVIDYVRSAESALPVVEPIRGKVTSGQFVGEWLEVNAGMRGADDTFKGLTRAPLITEMGFILSSNTTTPQGKMFVEVYLPKEYGIPSVNLLQDFRYYFQVTSTSGVRIAEPWSTDPVNLTGAANLVTGNGTLAAGQRAVISMAIPIKNVSLIPAPGEKVALRVGITRFNPVPDPATYRKYPVLEIVPIGDSVKKPNAVPPPGAMYTVTTGTTTGGATAPGTPPSTSLQSDDPRVSGIAKDWVEKAATWGNGNPIAPPQGGAIEQDTDSSGAISQASLYMPAASVNDKGVVSSNGELGYLHTGMQVTGTGPAGVPWRTIRLQPSKQAASVVPDWAFMDLFTAPITVPDKVKSVFAPHDTATGGRVNINAWAEPASSSGQPFGGDRVLPLRAVFRDAYKDKNNRLSVAESQQIADNIYHRTLASNGKLYGYTKGFYSQGEVVEIKGVADAGEESEELVRQIGNLVTARGDVFSVYSIGQSVKQAPNGKLLVTAESRQQAMIERYVDAATKKVRFKTVYSRSLTP